MNFECHGVSGVSRLISVNLQELATNIITDWMPGTPNTLANGFMNLLSEILEQRTIGSDKLWTAAQRVAGFEKQWKQVTSWILGVAFSKKVFQMEGYAWWAPVSAFKRHSSILFNNWQNNIPFTNCSIKKPNPPISKLMPDYVLVQANQGGSGYYISFAESKGCQFSLEYRTNPPMAWRDQSRNAEFYCNNIQYKAKQNLIVATRLNPKASKPKTRRLYVRVWNSNDPKDIVPIDVFRDILYIHYFGLCERIGLKANAQLLRIANEPKSVSVEYGTSKMIKKQGDKVDEEDLSYPVSYDIIDVPLKVIDEKEYENIIEQAKKEIKHYGDIKPAIPISIAVEGSRFLLGERTIRIGMSDYAIKVIKWLQSKDVLYDDKFFQLFNEHHKVLSSNIKESDKIFVRADGVISIFED